VLPSSLLAGLWSGLVVVSEVGVGFGMGGCDVPVEGPVVWETVDSWSVKCCVLGSVIVIVSVVRACTMGKLCFLKLGHLLSCCVVVGVVVVRRYIHTYLSSCRPHETGPRQGLVGGDVWVTRGWRPRGRGGLGGG
jgi:hypothetical protein